MVLRVAGGFVIYVLVTATAAGQAPVIGADATAYLQSLAESQPTYSVTAAYYYKNFLKDEHKSWERRLSRTDDGRFERMTLGDTLAYFSHGDTLFTARGEAPDSVRGEALESTFREAIIGTRLRRHLWPDIAAQQAGWRRVPAQDNDAPGTQRYRRSATVPSIRKRDIKATTSDQATLAVELWLDPDGSTVRGVEQRLTFLDSLESVERFDFSDWRYGSIDAAVDALLALPRRTVVVEDYRKQFAWRTPRTPIVQGEPMPVIQGVGLDSVPVTASRSNVIYFFSFVHCKPCGLALDQMRAGGWAFRGDAKLVYVNPIDDLGEVTKYVADHYGRDAFEVVIPDVTVSRGLGIGRFPTFVTVDAAGVVREISEMYNEDIVRDLLK